MHVLSKGHVIKVVQNATEITQVWCNEDSFHGRDTNLIGLRDGIGFQHVNWRGWRRQKSVLRVINGMNSKA